MAQCDLAGSVIPARHAKGRMATVAVNEFIFKQPVRLGDILSFYSKLERIGRTSITVTVEVFAERFQLAGRIHQGDPGDLHLRRDRRQRAAAADREGAGSGWLTPAAAELSLAISPTRCGAGRWPQ